VRRVVGLRSKSTHGAVIAARLREIRRCSAQIVLDKNSVSSPIQRSRSLMQGDPVAPVLFNATIDVPAGKFLDTAAEKGLGIEVSNTVRIS
jgi:hypothetical protein